MTNLWKTRKLTIAVGLALAGAVPLVALAAPGGGGGGMGGGMGGGGMGEMAEIGESQITVSTTAPEIGDISVTTEYIGKIEPDTTVNIYPKTSGQVTAVYVSAGDTVQAGDLLFEIDSSDLEDQLESAQAQYDSTVAQINQTLGSSLTQSILNAENNLQTSERSYNTAKDNLDELEELEDEYKDERDDAKDDYEDAQDAFNDYVNNYEMPDVTQTERYQEYQQAVDEAQAELAAADPSDPGYADLTSALAVAQEDLEQYVTDYNNTYAVENTTEYARLEAALERAQSAYDSADSTYDQFVTTYDATYESYRAEKANAGYTYSYNQEIYDLTTGQALEETQAIAQAQLNSAALTLQDAQEALEDCLVYAPIDGVIEDCLVAQYDMASTGTAAVTIANKSNMAVSFNVSADGASTIQVGDTVTVTKSGTSYTATVTEVSSKADDQSGLFPVKAALDDSSSGSLSGVSVKVTANTSSAEGVLLVPNDAVYYEDDVPYVYVYENGTARQVTFTAGLSNSQWVEMVDGLSGDERIITTWHPDLKDGAAVTLQEGDEAASLEASSEDTAPDEENGSASAGSADGSATEAGAEEAPESSAASSEGDAQGDSSAGEAGATAPQEGEEGGASAGQEE
ncbi:MAG TPA: efflux RND transporter periplasmic adaptor subunit [Firmicutes bacterium]|nr:efflux RND transporter periplasmic adaptor subunit [Bacillota bacterium]